MQAWRGWFMVWKKIAMAVVVAGLVGCASTKPEGYVPNPPDLQGERTKLRVAVVELENQSPGKEIFGGGAIFLPGVLYAKRVTDYPSTNFGSCVASELRASELFSEVTYVPNWGMGPETFHKYDAIVSGGLKHDRRTHYATAYGISFLFAFPALYGAPIGWEDREASFEIWATRTNSPSQIILLKTVSFVEPSVWYGLYSGEQPRSSCPTESLQTSLLEFRLALLAALSR